MPADSQLMEKLVALCKRRGFIFQSSEIYGGIGGFWDYGPLGVELKRNIKNQWWQDMVTNPPVGPDGKDLQMVGLDCSIIMNPKVWEASGHATGFADPMVDCMSCKKRFRADKVWFVTVMTRGSITNLDSVLNSGIAPQASFEQSNAFHVAVELEVGGVTDQAAVAIREFAKKANKGPLRRFVAHGPERRLDSRIVFHGRDGNKEPANNEAYDFECVVEPSLDPKWTTRHRPCPACLEENTLTEARAFNLMFKTFVGAMEDGSSQAWLRPETAQGIFANYKNVVDTSRVKIPFGIAQVGKAFRNEINPRNFTFRSREFEQMEIEFFCRDEDSLDWYQFWRNTRYNWYVNLGLKSEKLRLRDQAKDELAHYSKACADIEYLFPFSDEHQELEGCAHRGCFDLTQHEKHSGVDLHYFEEEKWAKFLAERKARGEPELTKEQKSGLGGNPPYRYLPTVIEPSAGADRATLAFLCEAYTEEQKPDAKGNPQTRVYMRFHPKLAPIKAAFLPLVNKEGMPELAERLYRDARKQMNVFYDDGGSIGRRYARMDEAGTPFCITIDGDTVSGDAANPNRGMVTIRDRDTLEQIRVPHEKVVAWLKSKLGAE